MPNNWSSPPIIKAALKLQQLKARIEHVVLHEKLLRAKALLAAEEQRLRDRNGE